MVLQTNYDKYSKKYRVQSVHLMECVSPRSLSHHTDAILLYWRNVSHGQGGTDLLIGQTGEIELPLNYTVG
jgi:hypothetical protein